MMKIKRERQDHAESTYQWFFDWRDAPGSGFVFDCDAQGNLLNPNPDAAQNFHNCKTGVYDVIDLGIREFRNTWTDNAVGICDVCGADVELGYFTCPCERCGAEYNWAGQRLASRDQWGEETGEHPADIGRIE